MSLGIRSRLDATGRWASSVRGYALALATVAVALIVTLTLDRPGIRGTPFIPAIMVSAWYGGVGPGLAGVGLSLIALDYFIVPRHGLGTGTVDDAWYLVIFLVSALFVAWLTRMLRDSIWFGVVNRSYALSI